MKVLVVGSGGREHALVWKLSQSPLVSTLYAAPGNPGMAAHATLVPDAHGPEGITARAVELGIDLVVVGPEQPLVEGLTDRLREAGIMAFGPHAAAAQLEGSKRFSREFMLRHGVPAAASESFGDEAAALAHLETLDLPPVVKKAGLAAGKGVTVATDFEEAAEAIRTVFLDGDPDGVVLEERLHGRELSLIGITDGRHWLPLLLAQDYKYFGEGDTGPMTGGMGAVAPAALLTEEQRAQVDEEIVQRTLKGLQADGLEFAGVLFIGLMVTDAGVKVLEYNVRFGDPETQSVLPLLKSDLLDVIVAACRGDLSGRTLSWHEDRFAAGVVLAAPGYPGQPERGIPLDLPEQSGGVTVFQAGTAMEDGRLVSSGGRVLNVVGVAADIEAALGTAYRAVERTGFPGAAYRRDIGRNLR